MFFFLSFLKRRRIRCRGDHTSVDFYLVVIPPKTECVVFSIDGSFTASVSVTGRDPKVRAGAVDVVRHVLLFILKWIIITFIFKLGFSESYS